MPNDANSPRDVLPGHVRTGGGEREDVDGRDDAEESATAERRVLPERARVVIVGGGVIGCSIAWHLTRRGCDDVLLLERRQLGCGTTWHSQGLCGLVRENDTMTRLAMHTNEVLPELERLSGLSTGFQQRGTLIVSARPDGPDALARLAADKARLGLEIRPVSRDEAARLWPPLHVDDLTATFHMPMEGQTNPLDTLQAYAKAARLGGARLVEGVAVEEIVIESGRAIGVRVGGRAVERGGERAGTRAGTREIAADAVVDASGIWCRAFAARAGLRMPMLPVRQSYLVTEPLPGVDTRLPILRDFRDGLLAREDARQLTVAALSAHEPLYGVDGIPEDFCFDELPENSTAIEAMLERLVHRVPVLADVGLRRTLTGPECVAFDARYCLGEAPGLAGYFVASGMSGVGVGSSGGIGREMAAWILDGAPTMDLGSVDVRRAEAFQTELDWLVERVPAAAGGFYDTAAATEAPL